MRGPGQLRRVVRVHVYATANSLQFISLFDFLHTIDSKVFTVLNESLPGRSFGKCMSLYQ